MGYNIYPITLLLFLCILPLSTTSLSVQSPALSNLNLSPPEKFLLQSRLTSIQNQIRERYQDEFLQSQNNRNKNKSNSSNSKAKIDPNTPFQISRDLVLIFPGAGGPDMLTSELQDMIRNCDLENNIESSLLSVCRTGSKHIKPCNECNQLGERTVCVFDWSSQRGSLLTAAYDGEAVGDALAQCLSNDVRAVGSGSGSGSGSWETTDTTLFRSLHVIGISVGAFAAHQFVQTCHKLQLSTSYRITFLDPFTSRGVFGANYGLRYFGQRMSPPKHSERIEYNDEYLPFHHAEHYLNTDDPVPSTNSPLPNCEPFVMDITEAEEKETFILPPGESMHCWPLAFFARYGYKPSVRRDGNGQISWQFN